MTTLITLGIGVLMGWIARLFKEHNTAINELLASVDKPEQTYREVAELEQMYAAPSHEREEWR